MQMEFARDQMITQQVRAWDVLDERVLELMSRVPRELFVPAAFREVAYADTDVPLGHGQRMLAPKVAGRILQAVDAQPLESALEIGTGSGYVTACLAASAREVRSLEIHEDLAAQARRNLAAAGVANAEVVTADAFELPDAPRYDVIVLTGSLPLANPRFQRALRIGGRLFAIAGSAPVMEAQLVRRVSETLWNTEALFETVVEPLVHAAHPPRFRF